MSATRFDDRCDYCGLPVGASRRSSEDTAVESTSREPHYCCYGCQFAAGVAQASGDTAQTRWLMTRLGLSVFFTMNVMVFTLMLWSEVPTESDSAPNVYFSLTRYLALLFATPVIVLLGGPLAASAWDELRAARPSLNGLLAAGVVAAFGFSVLSVLRGEGHVYFEVSCGVLVFVTLGRWLEATGKLHTTAALRSLEKLLPDQVRLVRDGQSILVSRELARPGDIVRVAAGERIPLDGIVTRNRGNVDQQVLTGESLPSLKEVGDEVLAGTLNLDGDLYIRATSSADSGLVARLIDAVACAASEREPYQRLAARISRWFVPLVAAITLGTFAWHAWSSDSEAAMLAALSVAVIACPCALGLATPMALWAALGRAAQARILIQEPDALSSLAEADTIFFDKTGTLSTGQAKLQDWSTVAETPADEVMSVAVALARASNHPLSRALVDSVESSTRSTWRSEIEVEAIETLAGRGLRGWRDDIGEFVWLGSRRLMIEARQELGALDDAPVAGGSGLAPRCFVAWGGLVRGVATFDESFRPRAADVLSWFTANDWSVAVLTGDRKARGDQLSAAWGTVVNSEQLPAQKLETIRTSRGTGRCVVMVGDGINDAPALAAADVGIALGCGADVARLTAAVCLLSDDLRQLPWLVKLARRTTTTVRWNLFWAFGYNVLGIGIAAVGWLHPAVAALAMVVSSVLVVSNSLRLAQVPLPEADLPTSREQPIDSPVEVPA